MIQMNQNQVVYKYIKMEDSLKTFVKEKENQAKNQRNRILLRKKIVVQDFNKRLSSRFFFLIIGDRGRKCQRYFRCQQNHKCECEEDEHMTACAWRGAQKAAAPCGKVPCEI